MKIPIQSCLQDAVTFELEFDEFAKYRNFVEWSEKTGEPRCCLNDRLLGQGPVPSDSKCKQTELSHIDNRESPLDPEQPSYDSKVTVCIVGRKHY